MVTYSWFYQEQTQLLAAVERAGIQSSSNGLQTQSFKGAEYDNDSPLDISLAAALELVNPPNCSHEGQIR